MSQKSLLSSTIQVLNIYNDKNSYMANVINFKALLGKYTYAQDIIERADYHH